MGSELNAQKRKTQSPKAKAQSLDLGDVFRRRSLLTLHHVEFHPVPLGEGLEAVALDRRIVDEAILAAAVRGDEAEALRIVEPLHYALGTHHCTRLVKMLGTGVAGTKKGPRAKPGPLRDRWNDAPCAE